MRWILLLAFAVGAVPIAAAQDVDAGAGALGAGRSVDGIAIPAGVTGPITWAASHGSDCHRSHGRRVCEGPRRVPEPSPEAASRAATLGITGPAARRALLERPRDAWVAEAGSAAPTDLAWPVDGGRVWRGFGIHAGIAVGRGGRIRRTRRRHAHEGIDIGAPEGTPILAANDGLVVYSDNGMTGYGNAVLVVHADASVTLYGHCSATFVVPGQRVTRGEVIAAVGDTGLAHGAHLHFELHVDGHAIDPMPRIVAPPGSLAAHSDPVATADAGAADLDAGTPPPAEPEQDAP